MGALKRAYGKPHPITKYRHRRELPVVKSEAVVRRRREFPVKMTQRMQVVVQNNIVNVALKPGHQPLKAPLVMQLVTAVPWLQGITARFVGLGVRPEHVQSPVRC
jgi:hypothetical protein